MAIVRWEPFRDLLAMQDRMNRLFSETFGRDVPFYREEAASLSRWAPAVDVYETDDNIVVKAELPGLDPKDLDVRIEDNTLFLKGERKLEKEVREQNYHRVERSYGSFARSLALPSSVDPDKTSAEYKDGVLTLTMAKREEAKSKTIKIQTTGEPKQVATAARK
jgi:HSP20 family protein